MLSSMRQVLFGTAMAVMVAAPSVQAETLGDALVQAYRNSNLLEQNRALLRAADEGVAQSVAALRPTLEFLASSSYYNNEMRTQNRYIGSPDGISSTVSLTSSLTLYDGGAGRLGVEASRETVLAVREALVGVEQNVLLGAVNAYMGLRLSQDIVALREGSVRVLTRELDAAKDRFDLGEITRTDVALAEARLAAARAQLAAAEGEVRVGRESYNLAVGKMPSNLSNPPRPPVTAKSVDEAKRIARSQHFSIKRAQHELAASELNLARAKAAMGPGVGARASVGYDDTGLVDRTVSLSLSQKIYGGGGPSAQVRAAMANRDANRAALQYAVATVEQAVGEAWARRAVAAASIEASDRQITAARAAYEGVREEAKLGARTTLDVLNAEQELLSAQASRLEAVTSEYVANYSLLAAMGYLTVNHLKLGIPTYDVSAYYNAVKDAPAYSAQGKRLDRIMQTIGRGQ